MKTPGSSDQFGTETATRLVFGRKRTTVRLVSVLESTSLLNAAKEELGLSVRAHDKVLRVARTIAGLEGHDDIKPQFGLDTKLVQKMFSMPPNEKESAQSTKILLGRLVVKYFRHHDGTAVSAAEADALVESIEEEHRYEKAFQEQIKPIEARFQADRQLEKRVKRAFLRMTGLYFPLRFPLLTGPPEYEFAIALPGDLVETNGTGTEAGRTRWKFAGGGLFPDGYEMRARSILIDFDAQRKLLGHVAIDDEGKAVEFIETAGRDGPLLEAIRKFLQTGDRNALDQVKTRTHEESVRAAKLRKILFSE